MILELSSKTTNPKSGKFHRDTVWIFTLLFNSFCVCTCVFVCVWSAHMYLGVCVHVQARGKSTDCHSCALFVVVVVVVTICLFKRGVSH